MAFLRIQMVHSTSSSMHKSIIIIYTFICTQYLALYNEFIDNTQIERFSLTACPVHEVSGTKKLYGFHLTYSVKIDNF